MYFLLTCVIFNKINKFIEVFSIPFLKKKKNKKLNKIK